MPNKKSKTAPSAQEARVARHGKRMIEVRLRFWTDDIAEKKGEIIPKHAWAAGMINVERNEVHEITPDKWIPFNSMFEIPSAVEKCLIAHGVKLLASPKMKKYILIDRPSKPKA
jgi:hypothetical protein